LFPSSFDFTRREKHRADPRAMKQLIAFLKTTLIGGALVVLPAWLAVLLVAKALMHLQVFVKPVSSHLPASIEHSRIIAILLLLTLCFLVGLVIQTAIGAHVQRVVEKRVLEKLPGYTILHGLAGQLAAFEKTEGFQPALVEIEEALVPAFLIEELSGERCTVFVPSVPTPMAGSLYIIARNRVHPIDVPVTTMLKCISKWGAGSDQLVAALDRNKKTT
jgi:uncharacterized membrane protein